MLVRIWPKASPSSFRATSPSSSTSTIPVSRRGGRLSAPSPRSRRAPSISIPTVCRLCPSGTRLAPVCPPPTSRRPSSATAATRCPATYRSSSGIRWLASVASCLGKSRLRIRAEGQGSGGQLPSCPTGCFYPAPTSRPSESSVRRRSSKNGLSPFREASKYASPSAER